VYQAPRLALFQAPEKERKSVVEKRELGFVALLNYYLSTDYVTTKEIKAKNKTHPICLNNPKIESSSYAKSRESQLRHQAEKLFTTTEAKRILHNLDEVGLLLVFECFLPCSLPILFLIYLLRGLCCYCLLFSL
jgi:hypothetical protein